MSKKDWPEDPKARCHVPTGDASLFSVHVGGRLREKAVFSVVCGKRDDGRTTAKQLAKSYADNGYIVFHLRFIGRRYGDNKFQPSRGWKSDVAPVRVEYTISDKSGEFGPVMPIVKNFRPGSEFHLGYLITSHFFDVIVIEFVGDVLEEGEQKNADFRRLAHDLFIFVRGHRVTLITVNEIRDNLQDEPPTTLPEKNWAKGVSPYAESLTDECLFIGNSGGDDSPQWLCNPVRGTSELVWADKSAGIFRSVGQHGDFYEAVGDDFEFTEKARQLGLLSCADVADHIELETGSWKEVA